MTDPYLFECHVFDAEISLVDYLQRALTHSAQAEIHHWIAEGLVELNSTVCNHTDQALTQGDTVVVVMPGHMEEPVNTDWQIIWQNDELLVVFKPPLLPVSRTTRNLYDTLISLVRRQTRWHNAHLLHRLDTETSGLIVLAKDSWADKRWKPQLSALIERKIYQAQVQGNPEWDQISVKGFLAERTDSEIRSQMYLVEDEAVVENETGVFHKPKLSHTTFRVLAREGDSTRIEAELLTGRKHQIRAHLAALGTPVVGDKIYSHGGQFYLQRLQQPLDAGDFRILGSQFHRLCATELQLRPDASLPAVCIRLPEDLKHRCLTLSQQCFYTS